MQWYLMVWKKFGEFNGRSRRTEYWMYALFNMLAVLLLAGLAGVGIAISQDTNSSGLFFIPVGIYLLASLIPTLSVATRRFHDSGKSGWILLLLLVLGLIPIAGLIAAIIQLVFLCTDSDPGPNQYGPNPKLIDQALPAGAIPASPGYPPVGYPAPPQPPVAYPAPPQSLAGQSAYGVCKTCGAQLDGPSPFCGRCGAQV